MQPYSLRLTHPSNKREHLGVHFYWTSGMVEFTEPTRAVALRFPCPPPARALGVFLGYLASLPLNTVIDTTVPLVFDPDGTRDAVLSAFAGNSFESTKRLIEQIQSLSTEDEWCDWYCTSELADHVGKYHGDRLRWKREPVAFRLVCTWWPVLHDFICAGGVPYFDSKKGT